MNVASKGLCKDLHELSGWTGTHTVWHDDTTFSPFACGYEDINAAIHFIPAYDLGYLLRKLPATDKVGDHWALWRNVDETWGIDFDDYGADAATPEEAAAKLCIELFKHGILERKS